MRTNGTRLSPGQGWVLALTSAASLMVSLDVQVVATALPVIRLQLHASLAVLEWTVNAYTLSFAVLLLTGAALGERLGRRRMLAVGVGLFTAASAACALAPDAAALVAARAVQGAGAALMLPLALALLSAAFPPQRRAWALGIFSSVTGIAVLAGPVVGGAVTQGLTWPWIFWLNVPIGLIMIPLILTRIPATERARASLDPVGLILATGGALGIVWALIRADGLGWGSPEIAATLAAGIVLAVAFVAWELRAPDPMVPLRLFRSRPIAAGNAAAFCVFAMLLAMVFFMAQFLETGLGYGPLGAGLRLLPGWATLTLIAPFTGALISRVGERPLVAGGLIVVAGALTWIALIARPGPALLAPGRAAAAGGLRGLGGDTRHDERGDDLGTVRRHRPGVRHPQHAPPARRGVRRRDLRRRLRRPRRLRFARDVRSRLRPGHGRLRRPGPARRGRRPGHPRSASRGYITCPRPELRTEDRDQEITMQQSLIRYRTKPDQAAANEELVRAVYAELHRTRPDGFRYATLKLDDQVTFVHIVQSEHDPSPILAVKAFGEFQAGVRDRCDQPPVQQAFTEVGSYRFFT